MTPAELIEELRADLKAEEALAIAAGGGKWTLAEHESDTIAIYDQAGEPVVYDEGSPSEAQRRHIARHDPERVLADIAAKRAILDLHQQRQPGWCETCDVPGDFKGNEHGCPTVLALAEAYGIRA